MNKMSYRHLYILKCFKYIRDIIKINFNLKRIKYHILHKSKQDVFLFFLFVAHIIGLKHTFHYKQMNIISYIHNVRRGRYHVSFECRIYRLLLLEMDGPRKRNILRHFQKICCISSIKNILIQY